MSFFSFASHHESFRSCTGQVLCCPIWDSTTKFGTKFIKYNPLGIFGRTDLFTLKWKRLIVYFILLFHVCPCPRGIKIYKIPVGILYIYSLCFAASNLEIVKKITRFYEIFSDNFIKIQHVFPLPFKIRLRSRFDKLCSIVKIEFLLYASLWMLMFYY